jgi:hypothetical protein
MRKYLFEAIVLVVIEQTFRRFREEYLPWAWLLIFIVLTYELLWHYKDKIGAYCKGWSRRKIITSYFVAAIVGALLMCLYWYAVQRIYKVLATSPDENRHILVAPTSISTAPVSAIPAPVEAGMPQSTMQDKHPPKKQHGKGNTVSQGSGSTSQLGSQDTSGNSNNTQQTFGGMSIQQSTTGNDSPIVNSPITVGSVERRMTQIETTEVTSYLTAASNKCRIKVAAAQNSNSTPFANNVYDAFKAADWKMDDAGVEDVLVFSPPGKEICRCRCDNEG